MQMPTIVFKKVKAFAPATVANVGCGFDAMGFSIDNIGDCVTVEVLPETDNSYVEMIGHYGPLIPTDWDKNTASVSIQFFLASIQQTSISLKITIEKNLPLGSGMGSSAASSVAAVVAINHLFGNPYKQEQLLPFAMEGERVACGAAHADNVAPSLMGGFMLVRSYEPLDVVRVSFQSTWWVVVVHPDTVLKTADSRKILNQEVSLKKAIQQSANSAALMIALINQDIALMKSSIHDELAEPQRTQLIPNFNKIKEEILAMDAFNCNISGSGPSLFSICQTKEVAETVGLKMINLFNEVGLQAEIYVSKFNTTGATVLVAE